MKNILIVFILIIFNSFTSAPVFAQNPYLPLWEHLPDGEPRVFEDPDNPGKYRLYIIGSHDVRFTSYCGPDIRIWSAPVDDLSNWRDHGSVFTFYDQNTELWDVMYAPDLVEVTRRGGAKEYYLYPHSRGPGREGMAAKSNRPDGPFTPINVNENGRLFSGSIIGFDPHVYIEQIDDPNDPDYRTGFRAYAYWGFQQAFAAELDQNTMYSLRPGTKIIQYFIPSSSSYGVIRDPAGTEYPHVFPGEKLTSFNYFEAFSMRKVGNKYVLVFSGYSGPDYGLSSSNSTLRYAFGDTPLGPWRSGGVLVDSRAPAPNRNGTALNASGSAHNTHGGLQLVNGQWYVFYHRAPRGFGYARQAMVAPVLIEWDETPAAKGGRVKIRAYNPFSENKTWTARADDGSEYTGAQITSEGFNLKGLAPFRYYSAGIASYFSNPDTLQNAWNIWDNHQPVTNVSNNHIIGYHYFDLSPAGRGTNFNLFLTPKTNRAFSVDVWLDGPWNNKTWGGTRIGTIRVPVNSANEVTRFKIDVSNHVIDLKGKHAIFLAAQSGSLFDLIGLGFSSEAQEISRPVPPEVSISVNGAKIDLPSFPLRSTSENGITGFDVYEVNFIAASGVPRITAAANDPSVKIKITQINTPHGTAIVEFDYNGKVKKYRIVFTPWSPWGEPAIHRIIDCNPVFQGPARIAWGETIGYLDSGDPDGAVTFTVNAAEEGVYKMYVYHATPWGAASHFYQINGGEQMIFQYPQKDWSLSEFPFELKLKKGSNKIRIAYRSGITEIRRIELRKYRER